MIPCSASEIHRWNALDDLDDGISDRINDDLIPLDDYDHDYNHDYDYESYEDPDLLVMNSFTSSDSTLESSEEIRGRTNQNKNHYNNNNSSSEFSRIDEDGLILALDDRTNRNQLLQKREDRLAKASSGEVVTVRVKKSVKYGNHKEKPNHNHNKQQRSIKMAAANKKDIIRRPIVLSDIHAINSDGTMDSLSPTYGDENVENSNVVTVRVKKSVKHGTKETDPITNRDNVHWQVPGNSRDIVRPQINTIHSDGTISSLSPTNGDENFGSLVSHNSQAEDPKQRVAMIYSDGTIGYDDKSNNDSSSIAMVEQPVQKIATINSDGTISYRLDSDIANNETSIVASNNKASSAVATIHSDGFITYSEPTANLDAKDSPTLRTAPIRKSVSFDNIVTDAEEEDDNDDMDDDICDNIDDSRYTRSLHSMPVLEEVTEEESPLHSGNNILHSKTVSSSSMATPKGETSPTWLELKESPSGTTTMTPRRTNDDAFMGTTSDNLTSRWLGLSSHKKKKNGTKYQSMESSASKVAEKKFREQKTPSRKQIMLRVETCSTGSQSENAESSNDLEAGVSSSNGFGRTLCCRKGSPSNGYIISSDDEIPLREKTNKKGCRCRRRDWIAIISFVLIGITVGVASYFGMRKIFVKEGDKDRQEELTKEWTMVDGSPFETVANTNDSSGDSDSDASTTSSDFDSAEKDASVKEPSGVSIFPGTEPINGSMPSIAPSSSPNDMDNSITASPTISPTIAPAPLSDGMIPVIQDTATINEIIVRARREIELMIFADNDLIGNVSLVFLSKDSKLWLGPAGVFSPIS